MQPRITFVTLGVDDLERAVAFYRDGLGLATKGIVGTEFEHGAVAEQPVRRDVIELKSGLTVWVPLSLFLPYEADRVSQSVNCPV